MPIRILNQVFHIHACVCMCVCAQVCAHTINCRNLNWHPMTNSLHICIYDVYVNQQRLTTIAYAII